MGETVHEFEVQVVSLKASGMNTGHVRVECREVNDGQVIESGIVVGWWAEAHVAPRFGTRLRIKAERAD